MSIPVEFQLPEDIRTFFKDGASFSLLSPTSPDLLLQLVKGQRAIILIQRFTNPLAKSKKIVYIFHWAFWLIFCAF